MRQARLTILAAALLVSEPALAENPSGWEFQVSPYAWMSGLNGELGTIPGAPPVDADLSFNDNDGVLFDVRQSGPFRSNLQVLNEDRITSTLIPHLSCLRLRDHQ